MEDGSSAVAEVWGILTETDFGSPTKSAPKSPATSALGLAKSFLNQGTFSSHVPPLDMELSDQSPFPKRTFRSWAHKFTSSTECFQNPSVGRVQIGNCHFGPDSTAGTLSDTAGKTIKWNLEFKPNAETFHHIPKVLRTLKIAKSEVCTPNPDLRFNGEVEWGGEKFQIHAAAGNQGHIWGTKYAHRWAWAHANHFTDSNGKPISAALEILTAQPDLPIPKVISAQFINMFRPTISALFFTYNGVTYRWNTLLVQSKIKSFFSPTIWNFTSKYPSTAGMNHNMNIENPVPSKLVSLTGSIEAPSDSLNGVTYTDTNRRTLYCYNTGFAALKLEGIYENGSRFTLFSKDCAFETASNERQPDLKVVL